jgi:hypothetical protein
VFIDSKREEGPNKPSRAITVIEALAGAKVPMERIQMLVIY